MEKLLRLMLVILTAMAMFLAYAGAAYAERFSRIESTLEILQANSCKCEYYLKGWDGNGPYLFGPYNSRTMAEEYRSVELEMGTDSLTIIEDCECSK